MEDSKPDAGNIGTGGQIVAWVVLLFVLILLCLLPFLIGGVSISGLGKLAPSSPLFALCIAGFIFVDYTPALFALLVAGFFPGSGGARSVLRQVRTCRVNFGWYAIAVFGPAVLFLLDEAVNHVLGGSPPQHWIVLPSRSGFFPGSLFFSVMGVLAGTFGEEFGWRAFAQPRLQKRYSALKASILIGLVWGMFHLWILPICHCMSLTDVLVTQYLRLIATAVIYAWIYNSTKGSLFLVMVAHSAHNITVGLMPMVVGSAVIVALSYVAVAIVVVLMSDPRTLTRSNSGKPN